MRIAIIGGGFTGLSAAYELVKQGHRVTVFEKEQTLGGLAHGFKKKNWDWHLESAYHHLFTNDHTILKLIKELGLTDKLLLTRPVTANYVSSSNDELSPNIRMKPRYKKNSYIRTNSIFDDVIPFDSPLHLLTYPGLSLTDKLRTAVLVTLAKLYPAPFEWCGVNPFWQPLEGITAKKLFTTIGGTTAWQLLWGPLMSGKFGDYADRIQASWLWARIKKRTQKLYYISGGFHTLVSALEQAIIAHGGTILTNTSVISISNSINKSLNLHIKYQKGKTKTIRYKQFDNVLITVPTPIALSLVPQFDISNFKFQMTIPHLHAQTLILETKEPILKDTYWLNIMDRSFPFLAVVAHTNMVDKKHYGGGHLIYFGNYLPDGHPYLALSAKELLKIFKPFIQRLNPHFNFKFQILNLKLFVGLYAQPVHELHYSRRAPKLETPVPGIFLTNMDSIYPWDRGTNYAVELGIRAAKMLPR